MIKKSYFLGKFSHSKLLKNCAFSLLSAFLIISQTSCSSNNVEPVSATEYDLLNTTCTITIYDMNNSEATQLIEESFDLCREYEKLLSKTIDESDIYKLNHSEGNATPISDDTLRLLEKGVYYGDLSDGRFDITIGRLSSLWDFKQPVGIVPDPQLITEAVSTINYTNIQFPHKDGQAYAYLQNPKSEVDLGGIAKGYIADKVTEYLVEQDVKRAIINLGGNIVAIGNKAENTTWTIGVEKPYTDRRDVVGSIPAENMTIVTSGVYERCFTENDVLYHHILNPNTGYPCETDVDSVTLCAPLGYSSDCDALSTICLMLGVDEGLKLIESIDGIEAAFICTDGQISLTSGMKFTPIE